jgi:hypothetical protein
MQSTMKRLAAVAALGTIGILAPAAGASAAVTPTTPPKFALPGAGLPAAGLGLPAAGLGLPAAGLGLPAAGLGLPAAGLGTDRLPLSFVGPSVGQIAAVIGPTVITTAPSTFTNTNLQTAAGSNLTGGQAGP